MSHVFGPVPSRRLGRSLGVDVVPFKTCTYDCLYCQLGRTTCKTVERREWVPLAEVLADVRAGLSSSFDYITLSGSGEPTLFARLGELVEGIKSMTEAPLALLTNGSLLWQTEVRDALTGVDLLIPSLDAGDASTFRSVNRPHPTLEFERMLEGLVAAREACRGQYWLEIFLLTDYTDSDVQVRKLARCAELIAPDRVQLNTATRPTAEGCARAVAPARLAELASRFEPAAEVIAEFQHSVSQGQFSVGRAEVLELLCRRPCTLEGIGQGLGAHLNEVIKYIEMLRMEGLIEPTCTAGDCYYEATDRARSPDDGRRSTG